MRTLRMQGGANDFVVYFIDKNYIVDNLFFLKIYIKYIRIKYFMGVIIFLSKIFFDDKNVNGRKTYCRKSRKTNIFVKIPQSLNRKKIIQSIHNKAIFVKNFVHCVNDYCFGRLFNQRSFDLIVVSAA
mgnify:CR=1 FL=1